MRRALAVTVAAAMLAMAASAQAAPFTPRLNLAYKLATEFWGGEPKRCAILQAEVLPSSAFGFEGASARAAVSPMGACELYVSDALLPPDQFARACATMVGLVGYLRGHPYFEMPAMCLRRQDYLVIASWSESAAESQRARCPRMRKPKKCWSSTRRLVRHARRMNRRFWAPLAPAT